METGRGAFAGFQPIVKITERMMLSDINADERDAFVAWLGDKAECTRSGEIVFNIEYYKSWKTPKH